jgi:hypothetical protein
LTERPESREERRRLLRNDPMVVADWYGRPDDDDVCEPCIRALEDPDEMVREAAVAELMALDDMYASTPIFGTLLHGSVPAREAAARVLGAIGRGDILAFQYLSKAVTDPEKTVRLAAVRALMQVSGGLVDIADFFEHD